MSHTDIKEAVRERYSEAARRVSQGGSCCGGKAAAAGPNPVTSNLYDVYRERRIAGSGGAGFARLR